ncbi:MAG: adenylate kinase [Candidatus Dojkabacteria bacterium]
MNILFIGPSGSGKDTQCQLLKDNYNYKTISAGDLIREEIAKKSEIGEKMKHYIDEGLFLPDEMVRKVIGDHIAEFAESNLTLNGVVRSFNQIKILDELLEKVNQKVDAVIVLELDEETATSRLLNRGRSDDEIQKIINRLREYNKDAEKIVQEYESRGIVLKIDASKPINEIHKEISDKLNLDNN